MGYLERNSETLKTPGFSGFECRVSGIGRVSIFGFGLGSGSKKVGLFPRVSGFRVFGFKDPSLAGGRNAWPLLNKILFLHKHNSIGSITYLPLFMQICYCYAISFT